MTVAPSRSFNDLGHAATRATAHLIICSEILLLDPCCSRCDPNPPPYSPLSAFLLYQRLHPQSTNIATTDSDPNHGVRYQLLQLQAA